MKTLEEIKKALEQILLDEGSRIQSTGICTNLQENLQVFPSVFDSAEWVAEHSKHWRHYSGNLNYPVPVPSGEEISPYDYYYKAGDYSLWKGKQLEMRESLLGHLIKECELSEQALKRKKMKTLQEIKDSFESTNAGGDKVNILAYHPEQAYPIIAEYYYEGEWQSTKHKCGGGAWEFGESPCVELNLIPKKVGIDYSKLPEDILCEVNGEGITPLLRYSDGEGQFYQEGRTSKTRNFAHKTMVWSSMKVIENKPVAWFGGKCPIPEGVKFKVWYRNGGSSIGYTGFDWSHGSLGNGYDIIAYQILGEL